MRKLLLEKELLETKIELEEYRSKYRTLMARYEIFVDNSIKGYKRIKERLENLQANKKILKASREKWNQLYMTTIEQRH